MTAQGEVIACIQQFSPIDLRFFSSSPIRLKKVKYAHKNILDVERNNFTIKPFMFRHPPVYRESDTTGRKNGPFYSRVLYQTVIFISLHFIHILCILMHTLDKIWSRHDFITSLYHKNKASLNILVFHLKIDKKNRLRPDSVKFHANFRQGIS